MEPDLPLEEQQYLEYEGRKARHLAKRDAAREKGEPETWPERAGIYKEDLTVGQAETETVNGIKLEGIETIIYKQAMEVLEAKKKDNVGKPVVVLDLGGMYGLTFLRLAKATEELVKEGKIVYVVSNLTFNPGIISEDQVKEFPGLNHSDYNDFFLQNRGLVHFIVSDVDELGDTQIDLPDGGNLQLGGNIDIIHEQSALGKSTIPDSDLPTLGKTLSPYGIFFLGDKDPLCTVNPPAFEVGVKNLLQIGVTELDIGDSGIYRVFVKEKSPRTIN